MQKIYYEITKTMNNLPISIYPHKKSPCQICTVSAKLNGVAKKNA